MELFGYDQHGKNPRLKVRCDKCTTSRLVISHAFNENTVCRTCHPVVRDPTWYMQLVRKYSHYWPSKEAFVAEVPVAVERPDRYFLPKEGKVVGPGNWEWGSEYKNKKGLLYEFQGMRLNQPGWASYFGVSKAYVYQLVSSKGSILAALEFLSLPKEERLKLGHQCHSDTSARKRQELLGTVIEGWKIVSFGKKVSVSCASCGYKRTAGSAADLRAMKLRCWTCNPRKVSYAVGAKVDGWLILNVLDAPPKTGGTCDIECLSCGDRKCFVRRFDKKRCWTCNPAKGKK